MWRKTAIKQVLKYVSLSPDDLLAKALEGDSALDLVMSLDDKKAPVKQDAQVPEEPNELRPEERPATVASSSKVSEFVTSSQALESAEDRTLPMFHEPENQPSKRPRRRSE